MVKTRRLMAEELFQRAADLPPGERTAFLARECPTDTELRNEVERILQRFENPRNASLQALEELDTEAARNMEGERIGPYRLLQLIGEGGFGAVYMAEQEEPIRRKVALKIIKLGMDTRQVIARFEAERQALAMMDHPSIARVFDAGATDKGRPYFVMELVKGIPITEYCDANRLTTRQRLELFTRVCRAVQHAHQKGVIHRDLKPSNILVTLHDTEPVPKVIDFGIAMATDQPLTEKTLFTRFGQFIGTPQYMSPEQGMISGLDIDTRSDIYSLGVLLYELLAGTTPFDAETLNKAGISEMQRILLEDEPPTLSHRVKHLGDLPGVAQARQSDPKTLCRLLHGELEWIVMKALEKDRTRRFDTAADLAADVDHYLRGEPVLAGPPSRLYLFRKTVARHKAAFAFIAALLVLASGFAVWMSFLYTEADLLRQEAESNMTLAREAEKRAVDEAEVAGRVSDFLVELFNVSDPFMEQGETITAREILDRGAEKIETELESQPFSRAALMYTMGRVYVNLGLHTSAEPLLEGAFSLRLETLGEDHPDTLNAKILLGRLYMLQARYVEAESVLSEALGQCRSVFGDEDRATVKTVGNLAWIFQKLGRVDEAEALAREALDTGRRMFGKNDADTLGAMQVLGWVLQVRGKVDEAVRLCRESLEIQLRLHGENNLGTANALDYLAALIQSEGNLVEAEDLFRRTLQIRTSLLEENHLYVTLSRVNLAGNLHNQGKLAEAEPLYRLGLEGERRLYGDRHHRTLNCMVNLGRLLVNTDRPDEGLEMLFKALDGFRDLLGRDDPLTFNLMPYVGEVLLEQDEHEKAESLFTEYLAIRDRVQPGEDGSMAVAKSLLGACLIAQKRYGEAEMLLKGSLEVFERDRELDREEKLKTYGRLRDLYDAWGKAEEASRYSDLLEED